MEDDKAAASSGVPPESAAAVAAEGEEKKESTTPKDDTTKNDGASDKKAKVEQPSSGRAKRERKTVKAFNPEEFVEEKKEIEVPDGAGVKIENMPNVVENLKAITYSDVKMKTLYNLIFGQGKKKDFRKHLMQFNGLVYAEGTEESEREKLREKMYKLTMPQLKGIMDLADINRSGDSFGLAEGKNPGKEEHVTRFIEWLEMPVASGKKKGKSSSSGKKRKSSSGSAKKEKKEKAAPAKKAKSSKKKKAKKVEKEVSSSDDDSSSDDEEIKLTIAGVDIDKVKAKVKSIVKSSDTSELTVKGVRKQLEEWLDCDLSNANDKDAVRKIVMEAM